MDHGLTCPACGAEFPYLPNEGHGSLVAPSSDTAEKKNIQTFWGDLCQQWYTDHDQNMTRDDLNRQLDLVERFFRKRGQLAVTEMPFGDLAGKTVLEIGSGGGAHSALFKRQGARVISVDITPQRVVSTALKLRLLQGAESVAFQADAENLPFADDSFDIVYSNGVLHHSSNTNQCIAEVHRVLKPGGQAVLMLYSRHSSHYWTNIVPRAILRGAIFGRPEEHWVGRVTEGRPVFAGAFNPVTRVYSARQLSKLMHAFEHVHLRKNSFRLDYLPLPWAPRLRNAVLRAFGVPWFEATTILYGGQPMVEDSRFELALGKWLGWCWNISATKPAGKGSTGS